MRGGEPVDDDSEKRCAVRARARVEPGGEDSGAPGGKKNSRPMQLSITLFTPGLAADRK